MGGTIDPHFHENINLCISLTKIKSIDFILVLKFLKEVFLKQKKYELNIFISYGDIGVYRGLFGVVGSPCQIQYLCNA